MAVVLSRRESSGLLARELQGKTVEHVVLTDDRLVIWLDGGVHKLTVRGGDIDVEHAAKAPGQGTFSLFDY